MNAGQRRRSLLRRILLIAALSVAAIFAVEGTVRVRQTAPVRGAAVQGRSRGARSFVLRRKGRAKRDEPPAGRAAPDPRGRGGRLDVRA